MFTAPTRQVTSEQKSKVRPDQIIVDQQPFFPKHCTRANNSILKTLGKLMEVQMVRRKKVFSEVIRLNSKV
jgi:hypothetical protein